MLGDQTDPVGACIHVNGYPGQVYFLLCKLILKR